MAIPDSAFERATAALDRFRIELPSWGFADTGTRFGKFAQPAAASTLEEKLHDAGLVHRLTGCCPTVAVHVLWDFDDPKDPASAEATRELAEKQGIAIGSINPNVFQDPLYKLGSLASPDEAARDAALEHAYDCIALGAASGSKVLSWWLADGTNYPGQDNLYKRKHRMQEAFTQIAERMRRDWPGATMLIEYKPFEPAFYHTDIADWGMAFGFAAAAGAMQHHDVKVLVDTGHHLPGANIEHIVAYMLDEGLLGGFHFNDRKYADDDLTLGSIDPYQVFRIFDQIAQFEHDRGLTPGSAGTRGEGDGKVPGAGVDYMVDQSHNLKPKLEAMVQTVTNAQTLFAKSHLVDRDALADFQGKGDIVGAEGVLKAAFETDVSPVVRDWRDGKGLPADPLQQLRDDNTIAQLGHDRTAAREARGETAAGVRYA